MISPIRTVLLFSAVSLLCLLLVPYLHVTQRPVLPANNINISFSFANAGPEEVEQYGTAVIESVCAQLPQLTNISSRSVNNGGSVSLKFEDGADMQLKHFEVAALIRRYFRERPPGMSFPTLEDRSATGDKEDPQLVYTVNGPGTALAVSNNVEHFFTRELSLISGVKKVGVSNGGTARVMILFDRKKLLALQLQQTDIIAAIQERIRDHYPGAVGTTGKDEIFIRLNASLTDVAQLGDIPVINKQQEVYYLKNIAAITTGEPDIAQYYRINGNNSVTISIVLHEETNMITVAKQVRSGMEAITSRLPAGYQVSLRTDVAADLERELEKNQYRALLAVGILLLSSFLFYRRWQQVLNLLLSLLVNVCLTLLLVYLLGINIHMYTLSGLAVAFGIMIDHAVIMIDYYQQYRNRRVFLALLAATLATVMALLLVFLLPDNEKIKLQDFAVIICISLLTSLITNLWFTVGLYHLLKKSHHKTVKQIRSTRKLLTLVHVYARCIAFLARWRKSFLCLLIWAFGIPFFLLPDRWEKQEWYNNITHNAVFHKQVRPILDKWLGGSMGLFYRGMLHNGGQTGEAQDKLFVKANLPPGSDISMMNDIISHMETGLKNTPDIEKFVTSINGGEHGDIEIIFTSDAAVHGTPYVVKARMIGMAEQWGGVEWDIYGQGTAFSNSVNNARHSFTVVMTGYNYDELLQQEQILANKLLEHKRIQQVDINKPADNQRMIGLKIDNQQLALSGISNSALFKGLQQHTTETQIASLKKDGVLFPVLLQEQQAKDYTKWHLMEGRSDINGKKSVKLQQLGSLTERDVTPDITKIDRKYVGNVSFDYKGEASFGKKFLDKCLEEMKMEMPPGYTAKDNDEEERTTAAVSRYWLILLLLAGNFIICSMLFESLRQPFYILITVPVSFIGLFLAFAFSGADFDQGGFAAFILLGGLVINAGIFIVHDFNNKRKVRGWHNYTLMKVIVNRGRTILLTTIATMGSMLPFLLEAEQEAFWYPLAVGTVGGLFCSWVAVFVVLPVCMWRRR
ncbi:efflux RND transporter permease subunit [Chitinophaga varians]|uniref:efflux RND transporter permease subunit n=1 Tax=Chitinophaga varians TaxID=2202339 RepID=UPI00165FDAEC|nr:efflux RND transporter permease subunit [Chitinophaga varians]MBC9911133.1 efflux RND transporter permease subunit [Chitinophaga varians]